jgi:hypothetical protein
LAVPPQSPSHAGSARLLSLCEPQEVFEGDVLGGPVLISGFSYTLRFQSLDSL